MALNPWICSKRLTPIKYKYKIYQVYNTKYKINM